MKPDSRGTFFDTLPVWGAVERLRSLDRRTLVDRLAEGVVRAGGVATIASILAILLFLVVEVWPLLRPAEVAPQVEVAVDVAPMAIATDAYKTHVAILSRSGAMVTRLSDRTVALQRELPGTPIAAVADDDGEMMAWLDEDGTAAVLPVEWRAGFAGGVRVVEPVLGEVQRFESTSGALQLPLAVRVAVESDSLALAAATESEQLVLFRRDEEVNEFTEEVEVSVSRSATDLPDAELVGLEIDAEQANLYAASTDGRLFRWSARPSLADEPKVAVVDGQVSAIALLLGGRALVVGLESGRIQIWFPSKTAEEGLVLAREFPAQESAIRLLAPSRRDKGFVAVDGDGGLGIYHSTSERVIWRGDAPLSDVEAVTYAPKADGIVLSGSDRIALLGLDNPHADVSLASLFLPVWYEGYEGPENVWQSSSGTDDFEPKYSLTPLLVGTLKGTFYSLLIAIPLGVLGAMYVSQFMHPRLRNVVKPTVEIMAALPSVVLGFLAGLWLAPRVEEMFSALLLMLVVFPLVVVGSGWLWERLPSRWLVRFPAGSEALLFCVTLTLAGAACISLSDPFEAAAFGGDFQSWLLAATGLQYDQRNAIIVGLAMGFAVIPIIFAISEDAFSNVPKNLVSGSLALGANRWQTVSRVVLPTASPGIFSAIMVGFGRAVGETMVVLMATGNTPIQDWNPFNGFRTLSANIAVEIPEAPQFGTLYRVLFLAALLLFVVTFAVNTAAELVRQRLRERYARL